MHDIWPLSLPVTAVTQTCRQQRNKSGFHDWWKRKGNISSKKNIEEISWVLVRPVVIVDGKNRRCRADIAELIISSRTEIMKFLQPKIFTASTSERIALSKHISKSKRVKSSSSIQLYRWLYICRPTHCLRLVRIRFSLTPGGWFRLGLEPTTLRTDGNSLRVWRKPHLYWSYRFSNARVYWEKKSVIPRIK